VLALAKPSYIYIYRFIFFAHHVTRSNDIAADYHYNNEISIDLLITTIPCICSLSCTAARILSLGTRTIDEKTYMEEIILSRSLRDPTPNFSFLAIIVFVDLSHRDNYVMLSFDNHMYSLIHFLLEVSQHFI
jgi:hypothetical protein